MTDDEKVAQRYRELGTEVPPRALDEAILAAALHVRSSRQRWYAPLATAAVLVLAVAVTLNMQLERPDIVATVPQAAPPPADQPAAEQELKLKAEADPGSAAKKPEKEMPAMKEVAPMRRKDAGQAAPAASPAPAAPAAREPQPFAADRAAAPAASAGSPGPASSRADDSRGADSSVSGALARQMEERTSRDAEAAARAPQMGAVQALAKRAERAERAQADLQAQNQVDAPERELERIAQLRVQGRHEEADKALAEFRKRFPDYKITDAMRERIERR